MRDERVRGRGEEWRWTVVFLLTFRKICEIMSKTITGNVEWDSTLSVHLQHP